MTVIEDKDRGYRIELHDDGSIVTFYDPARFGCHTRQGRSAVNPNTATLLSAVTIAPLLPHLNEAPPQVSEPSAPTILGIADRVTR